MFSKPSLMTRIAVGKLVGFAIGVAGFFLIPSLFGETDLMFRLGFLFWYATVGAFIGVFGVITWHPILRLPMPWWFRSMWIGAWMNLVLVLFVYDRMHGYLVHFFGEAGTFTSPFWFVAEGALVGLLMGFLATKLGGEGKETVDER